MGGGPRRVVARRGRRPGPDPRGQGLPRRAPALHHVHLGDDGEAQGDLPHHGWLPDPHLDHPPHGVRHQARERRLLDLRRHRVGHGAQLHRLRTPRQRCDAGDVRGHPRRRGQGPVVADHRRVQGHDPLHGPDRHPHLHEVGSGAPGRSRLEQPPAARIGGRAHQPRGLDVVPQAHRRGSLSDRRHLVADRDRGHHDHAAAWRDGDQARCGHGAVPWDLGRGGGQRRRAGPRRPWWPPGDHPPLARDAARHLGRPGALRRDLLVQVRRALLRRRRGEEGRRRRPVAPRPGR